MVGARNGHMVVSEQESASSVTTSSPGTGPSPPSGPGPYAGPSDVCLVVGVIRRDRKALKEIYGRYGGELHGLALRLCGQGPAEEVLEEIFLELWRTPERFDSTRETLLTFLKLRVYGRAGDRIRSDLTRRAWDGSVVPSPGGDVECDEVLPSTADGVWGLLDALPAREREAIVLASFDGHTSRDVATLLNHAEGTVNSRIRSGLTTLHLQLSEAAAGRPSPPR